MPTRADKFPPAAAADLEAALASLEAGEQSTSAAAAPAPPAADPAPSAPTLDEPRHAPPRAQAASQAPPRARTARRRPLPASPPSLRVGRVQLAAELKEGLVGRQLQWIAWSALAGAVCAATGLASAQPLLSLAASLGLGAWAAVPRQVLRGPAVALAAVAATALTHLAITQDPLSRVAGPELLAAGAVVGLGLTWLDGGPSDRWRRLHGLLGGAAAAGLGWWASAAIIGPVGWGGPVDGALQGAMFGLVAAQALVASALCWVESDRIPKLGKIRATLAAAYRDPCLRARELDQGFDALAPDRESRDGLGEVAAWVYRLQWTLQALDRELEGLDDIGLVQRRVELTARAAESSDPFTRERLEATARHLASLGQHRRDLARERDRSAALSDYASAYLEEARASLTLARLQPGDHAPPRLEDVLGRLRSHAAEQDALRRTAREVNTLA